MNPETEDKQKVLVATFIADVVRRAISGETIMGMHEAEDLWDKLGLPKQDQKVNALFIKMSEQLDTAKEESDTWIKHSGKMKLERDVTESRARAAEAAFVVMREAFIQVRATLDDGIIGIDMEHPLTRHAFQVEIQRINSVLATDAGQPLLAELAEAKKDGARLDWWEENGHTALAFNPPDGPFWHVALAGHDCAKAKTFREAIDAAIAQKEGK